MSAKKWPRVWGLVLLGVILAAGLPVGALAQACGGAGSDHSDHSGHHGSQGGQMMGYGYNNPYSQAPAAPSNQPPTSGTSPYPPPVGGSHGHLGDHPSHGSGQTHSGHLDTR